MSHPVYGVGTSALVYIDDEVSDRADGVPIGVVRGIGVRMALVEVRPGEFDPYNPADLCLVRRADPNPKEPTT